MHITSSHTLSRGRYALGFSASRIYPLLHIVPTMLPPAVTKFLRVQMVACGYDYFRRTFQPNDGSNMRMTRGNTCTNVGRCPNVGLWTSKVRSKEETPAKKFQERPSWLIFESIIWLVEFVVSLLVVVFNYATSGKSLAPTILCCSLILVVFMPVRVLTSRGRAAILSKRENLKSVAKLDSSA